MIDSCSEFFLIILIQHQRVIYSDFFHKLLYYTSHHLIHSHNLTMSDENTTYVNKISPTGPTQSEAKLIEKLANSKVSIQTINNVNKEPMIPAVRTRHKNLGPWFITVAEGPILPCDHIEEVEKQLNLKSSPDMIFQDNLFSLSFVTPDPTLPNKNPLCESKFFNKPSDFTIKFTAMGALKNIEQDPESYNYVKVGSTESWQATRDLSEIPIKDQGNWMFSTKYEGEVFSRDGMFKFEDLDLSEEERLLDKKYQIDYDRLKDRSNPIMMSEDIVLYEDELDDNGQSQVRLRFRCMRDCFFILLRSYVRIDDILIRLIETRLFYLRERV